MARSGGTQAARIWAAADLRRRWRSLVVLGLLAGLSASLAIAALSGARRADTAFDRLRERTDGADAVVFPSQVALYTGDWSELRSAALRHRDRLVEPRVRHPRGRPSGHVAGLHAGQGRLAAVGRPADRARGPDVGPVGARRGPGRRGRRPRVRHHGGHPGAVHRVPPGPERHRHTQGGALRADGGRDRPGAQPVPVPGSGALPVSGHGRSLRRRGRAHRQLARAPRRSRARHRPLPP